MVSFAALLPFLVASAAAFSLSKGPDASALGKAINKLGIDIHRKLATKVDGNLFTSPLSISTALGMLYYGSRGNTADEMRTVLGYKEAGLADSQVHAAFKSLIETISEDSAAKEYLLYLANAVLTQKDYPILPEYKDGLLRNYQATARDVDFQNEGAKAVEEINDWVKLKTNNQIEKLLDDIDPSTIMVLLNAVYFKGTWKTEFDPKDTSEKVFYNKGLQSEQTNVEMMHLVEELPYARIDGGRLLELPYKGEDIAMIIYLPDAMKGAYEAEQKLAPDDVIQVMKQAEKNTVHVSLPKFKMDYEVTLNDVLQELGMKNVFLNSADLSGISKAGPIAVSKIVHKAAIEVNEEGSEASGVTGVVIETRMGGGDNEFFVNRPFLFAMYDKRTNIVYFQGRVSQL